MRRIAKYLKPYLWQIAAVLALVFVQAMTDLQLPDYMSQIVNQGVLAGDTGAILATGLKMIGITLLGSVCTIASGYLASRVATAYARDLRAAVFDRVEQFSLTEFNKFSTASLITRSTNDVQQVMMVMIIFLRMIVMAPIMAVGGILKAVETNPSMTWIVAAAVACLFVLMGLLFTLGMPKMKIMQKLVDRLNLVTRENLTGMRVIRAFNTEPYEEQRLDKANRDLTKTSLFVNRLMTIMQPMMMLLMNATTVLIIWVGANAVGAGTMQVGDMMAFMQYAMQIMFSFLMVSMIFIMIPRASVSAGRIADVLETVPTITDPQTPKTTAQANGLVEFKDVTFAYPGAEAPALEHISFTARPGQTTAIIGSTGSGKSTIVNLLPRFYDVTGGDILIDGVSVKQMSQHALREKIGFVPQKGVLFTGTIRSNIAYGAPGISEEEICKAADIAQATEFISNLPEGLDTPIAQGGTNVSGGQKQRLSIARALAKKPEIYVFDDSFSALDFKTDAALRAALKQNMGQATCLLVAQRISTVVEAEQIIVLEEGKIAGIGTHKELMQTCRVYREIALSQLTEEELA
ncbi:MAG: ABC transporter ATP-binding protein [Christensenellales bacterium]